MDYCTGWFEGWWQTCCKVHDSEYAQQVGKALADSNLFNCVAHSGNSVLMASASVGVALIMWAGVSLFGKRYYNKAAPK